MLLPGRRLVKEKFTRALCWTMSTLMLAKRLRVKTTPNYAASGVKARARVIDVQPKFRRRGARNYLASRASASSHEHTLSSILSSAVPYFLSSPSISVVMPFTRSVGALLRTSRIAAQSSRSINPVNQVIAKNIISARTYATAFQRTKPHVNVGMWRATPLNHARC